MGTRNFAFASLVLLTMAGVAYGSHALAGGFAADAPTRIPVPATSFQAEVVDRTGVRHQVKQVTFQGEVFVFGKLGLAQVTVPFDGIQKITFAGEESAKTHQATVLTDEGEIIIAVDPELYTYGATAFGNYRIEVRHLREVIFRR